MAAISKISYLAIRSDSQNAVKRPNLVTLCSGLGWNSQSTTFFGRSLMFLMDFLTVQFLQNQLTIHQVSPFSVSNVFICFFFVFLFVSHLRLSQRKDDTVEGWLKPFYCHKTLPATAYQLF